MIVEDIAIVTGGGILPFFVPVDDVDVIDLSGGRRFCQVLNLPDIVFGHEMAKVNGTPIYCGGSNFNGPM